MKKFLYIILLLPVYAYGIHFSVIDGKYDCPEIHNSLECARHIESTTILADPRVSRKNPRELAVKLLNGKVRIYKDRSDSDEYFENASNTGIELLLNKGFLLIHQQFWEGGAYNLVDLSNGKELQINGYALVSPGNRYLAVVEMDLIADFNSNTVQLYRVSNTGFELIYDAKPTGWGPSNVSWQSANQLLFNITTVNSEMASTEETELYIKTPAKLTVSPDGKTVALDKTSAKDAQ